MTEDVNGALGTTMSFAKNTHILFASGGALRDQDGAPWRASQSYEACELPKPFLRPLSQHRHLR